MTTAMSATSTIQDLLAIQGGIPVRPTLLPYGRQSVCEDDIQAVVEVLRSDWLTTGPKVDEFEEAFAEQVGCRFAVAFSSGTAALHGAVFAAGIAMGDEVPTSPLTFAASANSILYQGGTPVFCDVRRDNLNIDPAAVVSKITSRTKALLPVDYAGHPADLDAILEIADQRGLTVIEDACHALGAEFRGRRVGSVAHMTVFSFHPVKHITTGEGGMVTTNNAEFAGTLRKFRNHGISTEARDRHRDGRWFYEMVLLGFNYRLSDVACALGLRQLSKLSENLQRRRSIAAQYARALMDVSGVILPSVLPDVRHAWHLYPIRLDLTCISVGREQIFRALRAENIGVQVHYIPVHMHPYYRHRFGYRGGEFPVAEKAYETLISLPIFPGMNDADVRDVISAVRRVMAHYGD